MSLENSVQDSKAGTKQLPINSLEPVLLRSTLQIERKIDNLDFEKTTEDTKKPGVICFFVGGGRTLLAGVVPYFGKTNQLA